MVQAFFEFLRDLQTPFDMVVAVVAISCFAGAVTTVAKQIRTFADNEADRRLKRDLYEAGYPADEVEQIVQMEVTQEFKRPKRSA